MKLVPLEPTEEIIDEIQRCCGLAHKEDAIKLWDAMLAAAPAVDAEPVACQMRRKWREGNCGEWEPASVTDRLRLSETHEFRELYAHPASAGEPVWLSIDSAPKDGTHILVDDESIDWLPVTSVHYYIGEDPKERGWHLSLNPVGEFSNYRYNPTHWMKIPRRNK